MVYMNAKNNLECDALDNLAQMSQVGSSQQVNIVVLVGRPERHYDCGDDKPWSGVWTFMVTRGQVPSPASALASGIDVHADMGKAATLASFVSWTKSNYKARKYALVIWNHGQGWRFQALRDRKARVDAAAGRAVVTSARPAGTQRPTGGYRSVSFDEETGSFLYNSDIQDSLPGALGGAVLDVVGFDACLMSMIETGYALKESGKVLVGSEELEPGSGWDYSDVLARLTTAPSMNAQDLGAAIVSSYSDTYKNRLQTTLASSDLAQLKLLSAALSSFAGKLLSRIDRSLPAVIDARNACRNYGRGADMKNPVDLKKFLDEFAVRTQDTELAGDAKSVSSLIVQQVVKSNYASTRSKGAFGSYGLSIYFPASKADFDSDVPDNKGYLKDNRDHPVQFVVKEKWADFLAAYLSRVPR